MYKERLTQAMWLTQTPYESYQIIYTVYFF